MADTLPSTSILPWIWVVEAIPSSSQVDISLLIDLVKKTPVLSDDMGKEAREVVSLRILESLAVQGDQNNNDVASAPVEKIGFDPSDSSEDVLRHVLQEMAASNLKKGGPEMLKWDLQSFIARKRGCIPRFTLQKLKDAILEGSHSVLASLKERSGIAVTTHCDDNAPVDDGNSNGLLQKLEESNKDIESVEVNRIATGNEDGQLQENLADRNLLPAKRNWTNITAENLDRQTFEDESLVDDCSDSHAEAAKKFKQDVDVNGHEVVQNLKALPAYGLLANSPEKVVENIKRGEHNLGKEDDIQGMDHLGHETINQYAGSKRLETSRDDNHEEPFHCQLQAPNDDNRVAENSGELRAQTNCDDQDNGHSAGFERGISNGTSQGVFEEENNLDKATNYFGPDIQQNVTTAAEAKMDIKHNHDFEITSDTDEYHDERTDIDSKKNAFLSTQCSYSQDSLATNLNHCVKCNKGGELLVCSSNTCPLVVHENCLDSAANFDGNGKFYCPFCAYSRAITEYLEVKKKASLARKDLALFIGLKMVRQPKFSRRSGRQRQNQLRGRHDLTENEEANDFDSNWKTNVDYKQEAEPSVSCTVGSPPSGERVTDPTHGVPQMLLNSNLKGKDMGQKFQSPRRQEDEQVNAQDAHKTVTDSTHGVPQMLLNSNLEGKDVARKFQSPRRQEDEQVNAQDALKTDILSRKEPKLADQNRRDGRTRERKKVSHQSEPTLLPEPSSLPTTENSEEENDKSAASKYSIRLRKQKGEYSYPAIPQLRRKPLPWTKVEEEKLKEGVQRLSSAHDRSIPWKQILEFGGDIFQKGRTTVDLKDKWRNICKGSPKPE